MAFNQITTLQMLRYSNGAANDLILNHIQHPEGRGNWVLWMNFGCCIRGQCLDRPRLGAGLLPGSAGGARAASVPLV